MQLNIDEINLVYKLLIEMADQFGELEADELELLKRIENETEIADD